MFIVKTNEKYKPHYIGMVITELLFLVAILLALYLLIDSVINREVYYEIMILLFSVGFFTWLSIYMIEHYWHQRHDEFIFEANKFKVKSGKEKVEEYTLSDIDQVLFTAQAKWYGNVYTDTVRIRFTNKKRKELVIYKDFFENYEELRQWLLENKIKIVSYENALGDDNPYYKEFKGEKWFQL